MMPEQLDIHRQKESQPTKYHALYKHKLKMDHRFKCKMQNYNTFRRKHMRKSSGPRAWRGVF